MREFITQNFETIVTVAAIVTVVVLVLCIIARLFRVAIGVAVLALVIPVLFTIFWGDGTAYVSKIASFLSPSYQEQVEEMYKYYKDKNNSDPIINYDAVTSTVSDTITDVFSEIKDKIQKNGE